MFNFSNLLNLLISSRWIVYFGAFQTINKFDASKNGKIRLAELTKLAEMLPNLKEISLSAANGFGKADIIDFIGCFKHVMKIHLIVLHEDQITEFDNGFGEEFRINTFWDEYWGFVDIERQH